MIKEKLTRSKFFAFWALLLAAVSLTSCLKDDDEDTVYYEDAALTSFSVSTMNKIVYGKSKSGLDSIYAKPVSCESYKFYIDQREGLIYNVDSLPYDLDLKKAILSMTSKNSGVVMLNKGSEGRDSLVFYAQTDTIDVSRPLEVRVYNMQGKDYRKYTLTVNKHQEDGDKFRWTNMMDLKESGVWGQGDMRLFCAGSKVFGLSREDDGTTSMVSLNPFASESTTFEGSAFDNVASNGETLYVLESAAGKMHRFAESGRQDYEVNFPGAKLLGASTKEIYALSKEGGLLVSTDEGRTWQTENLDNDEALLPTDNISCTLHALRTNEGMERVMLLGTCADKPSVVAWMKIVDQAEPSAGNWVMVANGENELLSLPKQDQLAIMAYGDVDVAWGLSADGLLVSVRESQDGLSWKSESSCSWPVEQVAEPEGRLSVAVDNQHFVWMILGDGCLWRGRLNKMGWTETQKVFR